MVAAVQPATTNDEDTSVRFLHLSDIHFTNCDGSPDTDVDHAVRERMLDDIQEMHGDLGDMHGVLVVGDIAARGKRTDYDVAARFLDRTCELVRLSAEHVVCVPGNHDIDRDQQSALHGAARFQLRTVDAREISKVLLGLLRDEDGKHTLLRPFEAYNEFALRYGCAIDHELLVWKPKLLNFGARSLYIHGVNSAWVCDGSDSCDNDFERAIVGLFQLAPIARHSSAVSIALCHHPLRWLRDGEIIDPWLARAQLVLTGHEHDAGVAVSDDRLCVRIASGAVNPVHTHDTWIPAYNVIELELRAGDRLQVRVFTRSWQRARAEFGPDQSTPQPYTCELGLSPLPTEPEPPAVVQSASLSEVPLLPTASTIVEPEPESFVSDEREMVYRVMSASRDVRSGAARKLGLLPDSEELVGLALDKDVIRRALADNRLAELMRVIYG